MILKIYLILAALRGHVHLSVSDVILRKGWAHLDDTFLDVDVLYPLVWIVTSNWTLIARHRLSDCSLVVWTWKLNIVFIFTHLLLQISEVVVVLHKLICLCVLANSLMVHHVITLDELLAALPVDCLLVLTLINVWEVWQPIFVFVFLNIVNHVYLLYAFVSASWWDLLSLGRLTTTDVVDVLTTRYVRVHKMRADVGVVSLAFWVVSSFVVLISNCINVIVFIGRWLYWSLLVVSCLFATRICVAALLHAHHVVLDTSFLQFTVNLAHCVWHFFTVVVLWRGICTFEIDWVTVALIGACVLRLNVEYASGDGSIAMSRST